MRCRYPLVWFDEYGSASSKDVEQYKSEVWLVQDLQVALPIVFGAIGLALLGMVSEAQRRLRAACCVRWCVAAAADLRTLCVHGGGDRLAVVQGIVFTTCLWDSETICCWTVRRRKQGNSGMGAMASDDPSKPLLKSDV